MLFSFDDPSPRRFPALYWMVPLLLLDAALLIWLAGCGEEKSVEEIPAQAGAAEESLVKPPNPWERLSCPTDQQRLLDDNLAGVIQPTASGRLESGLYGSVRSVMLGKRLVASFHEGIDIAPLSRDRRGQPEDKVYAAADGTVAYVNRHSGNSNYGIYVVLTHLDPLGPVYTLYAHLASVKSGLGPGQKIRAGDELGLMGHSSSSPIPADRAHLHFEVGMIDNARFSAWFRGQKLKPDHGLYHGRNLMAVDPRRVLKARVTDAGFTFEKYLPTIPSAFEIMLAVRTKPDYFVRYKKLAEPDAFMQGSVVIACSENGVPLNARAATQEERAKLGSRKSLVLNVDTNALGRNGARLLTRDSAGWKLGENGNRWLEVLLY
ncbi:MAG: M23 family metallopeptidase [Lentisphaerota bacterium]